MAFSSLYEEIQHMIQNILHRRLGFRSRRDAIHLIIRRAITAQTI